MYQFEPILKKKFPKLQEINFKFFFLRKVYSISQYEALYSFILNHKSTLKRLNILNPPLPPDLDPSMSNNPETETANHQYLMTQLTDSFKLEELTLKLHEFPMDGRKLRLARTLLDNVSGLNLLLCDGIDPAFIGNTMKNNASTLTQVVMIGSQEKGHLDFFCNVFKTCKQLEVLKVMNFDRICEITSLPKSIVRLKLGCNYGVSAKDIKYIAYNLMNLKSFTVKNKDFLDCVTFAAFLKNENMNFLSLTKYDKAKMLRQINHGQGIDVMFSKVISTHITTTKFCCSNNPTNKRKNGKKQRKCKFDYKENMDLVGFCFNRNSSDDNNLQIN